MAADMTAALLLAALAAVAVAALLLLRVLRRGGREGFDGGAAGVTPDNAASFAAAQRATFEQGTVHPVFVNTGVLAALTAPASTGQATIDAALATPDAMLPAAAQAALNPPRAPSRAAAFVEDPVAALAAQCTAADPSSLTRYPGAAAATAAGGAGRQPTYGCGWWYVDAAGAASTGALGNARAPADALRLTTQFPGGRWVWDLALAKQLEDKKACRRVTSCYTVASSGGCGWCPTSGAGVPVNPDGSAKYADGCGVAPVSDPAACAAALAAQTAAAAAASALTVDASGNVSVTPVVPAAALVDPCAGGDGSGVPRACLRQLALAAPKPAAAAGFTAQGALLQALAAAAPAQPGDDVVAALGAVGAALGGADAALAALTAALTTPAATPVPAALSRDAAMALFGRVLALQVPAGSGSSSGAAARLAAALRYLTVGGAYNPCAFDATDGGPFPLTCVAQAFLRAGCQQAGGAYPKTDAAAAAAVANAGGTWGGVTAAFKSLYASMSAAGAADGGDGAVAACLGIAVQRGALPPAATCTA
jgi:hypothetical protein